MRNIEALSHPTFIIRHAGVATAAIGTKTGLVASAAFQNPPFLPEIGGGLPLELAGCDDCHRVQLEIAAAIRE